MQDFQSTSPRAPPRPSPEVRLSPRKSISGFLGVLTSRSPSLSRDSSFRGLDFFHDPDMVPGIRRQVPDQRHANTSALQRHANHLIPVHENADPLLKTGVRTLKLRPQPGAVHPGFHALARMKQTHCILFHHGLAQKAQARMHVMILHCLSLPFLPRVPHARRTAAASISWTGHPPGPRPGNCPPSHAGTRCPCRTSPGYPPP